MGIKTERTYALGMKRNTGWRARLGDIDVIRPTQREAIEAVTDLAETMVSGSFEPETMAFGEYCAIVYRDITGWQYSILHRSDMNGSERSRVSCGSYDRRVAVNLARRHMVQMAYPLTGLGYLADREDWYGILDQMHWLGFQRAYERARRKFKDGTDAEMHRYATEHGDDADLFRSAEIEILDQAKAALKPASATP